MPSLISATASKPARPRTNRRPPRNAANLALGSLLESARKLVAWRRSLIDCEFTTYSFARCSRTLFRICQASSGCCSVGSLPISKIAGALNTFRHAGGCVRLAAQRRRQGREVRRAVMVHVVGLAAPRAQTSTAGNSLRWWSAFEPITPIAWPPSLSRTSRKLLADQFKRLFPRRRSQLAHPCGSAAG